MLLLTYRFLLLHPAIGWIQFRDAIEERRSES